MHNEMEMLRCWIVRGGTSKGVFIMENELPKDPKLRDDVILAIYGSPDVRQIDGLGGADSLTSKLAIIGPSSVENADVDYTFGQVSMTDHFVDYGGNCGNISSGVGPFAIDTGLVKPVEPVTTVRIHMTNTHKILKARVQVKDGKAVVNGDYKIAGCPGTGAKIVMDWSDAVGGCTGKLVPTGNAKDVLDVDGKKYTVSIIDAGNVVVFIKAEELGLKGTESAAEIDNNKALLEEIEKIRGHACVKIGLVEKWQDAAVKTPYQPFFAILSKPADYDAINNVKVKKEDIDITSRLLFMLKMHKTYAITGTVCTGAAARVEGSVLWELLSEEARKNKVLRIGHPGGALSMISEYEGSGDSFRLTNLETYRTARMIMEGHVYVNKNVFKK